MTFKNSREAKLWLLKWWFILSIWLTYCILYPFAWSGKKYRQFRARLKGVDVVQCKFCHVVQYGHEHQYCKNCKFSTVEVMYNED